MLAKERNSENYKIHFEGLLLEYFKEKKAIQMQTIRSACQEIIFHEFEMVPNIDGFLEFEKNTSKLISEYVYETLNEYSELMSAEQIVKLANQKYPELNLSENSIRTVLRDKEQFIFIGRSSTYGLKKWENEKNNLKGGTIRDIVEEYLIEEGVPKHIREITQFVLKYRATNIKNVNSNIKAEENTRFRFFPGGFIGLKNVNYNKNSTNYKKLSGAHFTNENLKKLHGHSLEQVIKYFVTKYKYQEIQVKSILQDKIEEGQLNLTPDNIIVYG